MVAVTFGGSGVATPAAAEIETKAAKQGKGFFARLFDAVTDAQMKRAQRELALHRHLLPRDFQLDRSVWSRSEEQLPFGGW